MKVGMAFSVFCLLVGSTVVGKELAVHGKQKVRCTKVPVRKNKVCYKDVETQVPYDCYKTEEVCKKMPFTTNSKCQRMVKSDEPERCDDEYKTQCKKVPELTTCHKNVMKTRSYLCKNEKMVEECREVVTMSKSMCQKTGNRFEDYPCKREEEVEVCWVQPTVKQCEKSVRKCSKNHLKPMHCLYTKESVPGLCDKEIEEPYDCSEMVHEGCKSPEKPIYSKGVSSHPCVGKACVRFLKEVVRPRAIKRNGKWGSAEQPCIKNGKLVPKTCYKKATIKVACSKVVKRKCDWKQAARKRASSCKVEKVKYECPGPQKPGCKKSMVMKNAVCQREVSHIEHFKCDKPSKEMKCTKRKLKPEICRRSVPVQKEYPCHKYREQCKQIRVKSTKTCYKQVEQPEWYTCPKTTFKTQCSSVAQDEMSTCFKQVTKQEPYECGKIVYKMECANDKLGSKKHGNWRAHDVEHKDHGFEKEHGKSTSVVPEWVISSKNMKKKAKRGRVDISEVAPVFGKHAVVPTKRALEAN